MIATGRSLAAEYRSQGGRSERCLSWRVNVGYDCKKPSATISSNNAIVHKCESLSNRSRR